MLATYTVAARSFDLLLPTAASVSSIFLRICWVWPLASAEGSPATIPARYTVSPWTTAWLNRGPTPCRLMVIAIDPFCSGNGVLEGTGDHTPSRGGDKLALHRPQAVGRVTCHEHRQRLREGLQPAGRRGAGVVLHRGRELPRQLLRRASRPGGAPRDVRANVPRGPRLPLGDGHGGRGREQGDRRVDVRLRRDRRGAAEHRAQDRVQRHEPLRARARQDRGLSRILRRRPGAAAAGLRARGAHEGAAAQARRTLRWHSIARSDRR